MANKLKPEDITAHHSSFVDPTGRLFRYEGALYRGIFPERTEMVKRLLASPGFQSAMEQGSLVKTEIVDLQADAFGVILAHQEIEPVSYPHEWAPEMLQSAALTMLDLALSAHGIGLSMSDANPWNLVPNLARPTFVDFGSFKPMAEEGPFLWAAYDQFTRLFLYPLYLCAAGLSGVVAGQLKSPFGGVDAKLCSTLLPGRRRFLSRQGLARLEIPRALSGLVDRLGLQEKIQQAGQIPPEQQTKNRRRFLEGLRADVERLKFGSRTSEWSDYSQGADSLEDDTQWTRKQTTIAEILGRLHPDTVLDVACNKGWFSLLATAHARRVVAFDTDRPSISRLTQKVLAEHRPVLPLVMNVLDPSPTSGWRLNQYPSAIERFRSDFVMALALIHHLVLSQMQDFSRVVDALRDFTKKWLLIEFVPLSDQRSQQILGRYRREQFTWYTEENFASELQHRFRLVESFPSHPDGRTLFLCTV